MTSPFISEIRIMPYPYVPAGWAACNGQLMQISQSTALFALLGTYYGGDGKTTFGLPDLRDAVPVGYGQLEGGGQYYWGETGGATAVTLLQGDIAYHNHGFFVSARAGVARQPPNQYLAQGSGVGMYAAEPATPVKMSDSFLEPFPGQSAPHNNMQPFLVVQYCIALQGVFPPRVLEE